MSEDIEHVETVVDPYLAAWFAAWGAYFYHSDQDDEAAARALEAALRAAKPAEDGLRELLREVRWCFNDKGLHISGAQGGHPDQQELIRRIDAALSETAK